MKNPPVANQAVDDATAIYILETRKYFEDLRQVAGQIAGLLVLAAAGGKSATPDHPMLRSAAELYRAASEGVLSARPSARAKAHHHCLTKAVEALSSALSATQRMEIDPILMPLRAAYDHLQDATKTLPGFEMIAFDQGCCGNR